ncbi:DNA-directed RNA polymerase I subunit RPA12 isoform X2 [Vanacampus margaritifer]
MQNMSCFSGDPNFCPECGNVLPLPGMKDTVCCRRCSFSISVSEFSGREIRSTVIFNPVDKSSLLLESSDDSEMKGPVIDRRCTRCNKEGMIYHTRQMRSADEGQTVFFTCIHCIKRRKTPEQILQLCCSKCFLHKSSFTKNVIFDRCCK